MFSAYGLKYAGRRFATIIAFCMSLQPAFAQQGLPTSVAEFGGGYGLLDPGLSTGCGNPNNLSGDCSCPGGTSPAYAFRVLKDYWGGWNKICSAGTTTSQGEFKGAFQYDDPVPGGHGCRVANAVTGSCSCPAGSTAVWIRNLTDSGAGIIGSHMVMCMQVAATPASFGGVFQHDDAVPGSAGCRHSNPFTGACTCPAGFSSQALRVQVDSSAGFIGSHAYTCVRTVSAQQVCPTVNPNIVADPTGASPADGAVQACINEAAPGSVVELAIGTYRIDTQVQISKPLTIRTSGTANTQQRCLSGSLPCAALQASYHSNTFGGIFAIRDTNNVHIDHLIINGNRSQRINSPTDVYFCPDQDAGKRHGYNAIVHNCTNCSFTKSASVNALCGTGLEWLNSHGAVINDNLFQANGQNPGDLIADGLTVLSANNATITNNSFIDNSDIGLILGGSNYSTVTGNTVVQNSMFGYAGFMIDNFNGSQPGDFRGTVISENSITCAPGMCTFAVNLGPHAWFVNGHTLGGAFTNNYVRGGYYILNVDGAGTPEHPIRIRDNNLGDPIDPESCWWGCSSYVRFNVSPDSYLTPDSTPRDNNEYTHDWH
jgi:parallel beta-helix repeat protein